MNTLNFVLNIVQALTWPAVVSGLVFCFRRPLRRWFERVPEYVKFPGGEIKWRERVNEVIENVAGELTTGPAEPTTQHGSDRTGEAGTIRRRLQTVTGQTPMRAVQSLFMALSSALWEMLPPDDPRSGNARMASLSDLADQARQRGLITDQTHNAVLGLSVMYDLAMSDPAKVDTKKALEFEALVEAVLYVLRQERYNADE